MADLLSYILVLNVISGATSLTIIARRVQNQSPSFYRYKIYAPEQYLSVQQQQQRAHRVTTHPPLIQGTHHVPKYRHKYRYHVKSVKPAAYPVAVAQRPRSPAKKYHEGRPLPTIVSNEVDETKEEFEHEADLPPAPIEEDGSFPSFGKESPYRASAYKKPGEWTTARPATDSGSTFTPLQMYLQVRQTNQVKHVPQSEAVKDATTLEEVVNAPRLKELLRTTRVREVYSEEGYEDAGYDHGGHIRHAEHDEGYVAQDEGLIKIKEKVEDEDYIVPEGTRPAAQKRNRIAAEDETPQESKLEPKISRSRAEFSSVEFATLPPKYKGEHKYSSKIKSRGQESGDGRTSFDLPATEMTTSNFWAVPTVFDGLPSSTSPMGFDVFSYGPTAGTIAADGSEKTTPRSKYIKIITSEEPARSSTVQKTTSTNSSASGGTETMKVNKGRNKGFKYSRLHAKYPKRDRFRLAKLNQPTTTLEPEEGTLPLDTEADDKRIILPTIGYINSLTTAHFGKDKATHVSNNNLLTKPLNLTQALSYLRSNRQDKIKDSLKSGSERRKVVDELVDVRVPTFEPMKLRKGHRSRRELENEGEDREEDKPDDGEDVHEEKNAEFAEEERQRIEAEREERKRYEKFLKGEIDREEEEIVKATLGQYGATSQSTGIFRGSIGRKSTTEAAEEEETLATTTKPIDVAKYPFYFSSQVHENSPLRYATNPKNFPRKTGKGMEFYESRDRLVQCPEVVPNLDDIPKANSTLESENGEHKRLGDLGDKIACLRMKYFDEDPLDNPLFKETEVDYVGRIANKSPKNEKNVKKEKSTKGNARKSRNSYYSGKEKAARGPNGLAKEREKAAHSENLRYHSSYQYHPNRTLHIMVKNEGERGAANKSPTRVRSGTLLGERIIPVTEEVDEAPLQDYTSTYSKISGLSPPPLRHKVPRPTYRPFISSTAPPLKAAPHRTKILIPHNCLFVIGKMAALDGHKNLIIDCNDGMLIQELRNDVRYLKIIPKAPEISRKDAKPQKPGSIRRKYVAPVSFEDSDWIPMTTYPSDSEQTRFGRKSDEVVQGSRNHHNESEHYLITELKEEEGVRKGEVVEDVEHYASVTNGTAGAEEAATSASQLSRRRRAVKFSQKEEGKQQSKDLPLRLSLKEFFLLLQSSNERNRISPKPFQLPSTAKPEESQEDEVVKIGSQYIKGTNGRELVYIKWGAGGAGRWVVSNVAQESDEAPTAKYSKKPLAKLYKKYGKGKFY